MKIDDLIRRLEKARDTYGINSDDIEVEVRDDNGVPTRDFQVRSSILLRTKTQRVSLEP